MSAAVLVTGADGFVGRRLVPALARCGADVLTHSIADGEIASCALPVGGARRVFHLAALSFVPDSWNQARRFAEVNVTGTLNVLEYCRREGAALTYVSSYVYGQPERLPVAEDHPRSAANPYALTKIMAEDACLFYAAHMGVPVCIVRPFNLYGAGQRPEFLIPTLVRQALDPSRPEISVADDRPKRDFLYVDDFIELLLATMDRAAEGVFNAGSGEAAGIAELVAEITAVTGPKRLVSRNECRPNEIPEVRADVSKAGRELGWRPRTSLRAGIREVVASAAAGSRPG